MLCYRNMVKMGWRKFFRMKSSILQIVLLVCAMVVMQLGIFAFQISSYYWQGNLDGIAEMMINILRMLTIGVVVALSIILPMIALLKVQDNLRYLALLKALGYTNFKLTFLQTVELSIATIIALCISVVISFGCEMVILKCVISEMVIIEGYWIMIAETILAVLAMILVIYLVCNAVSFLWIKNISLDILEKNK